MKTVEITPERTLTRTDLPSRLLNTPKDEEAAIESGNARTRSAPIIQTARDVIRAYTNPNAMIAYSASPHL